MSSPIVYLVGASPGDIDLMTVKSLRLVRKAQVIVYDRLANPDILKEAPADCEFIDVGKTDGHHPVKQDKINEIISLKQQIKELKDIERNPNIRRTYIYSSPMAKRSTTIHTS